MDAAQTQQTAASLVPVDPAPAKFLTASDILNKQDITYRDVNVPEWGGMMRLIMLTADEAMEFIQGNESPEGKRTSNARLIALCAIDDQGRKVFSDTQVLALMRKSMAAVMRLVNVALEMNGLKAQTPAEQAAAKNA